MARCGGYLTLILESSDCLLRTDNSPSAIFNQLPVQAVSKIWHGKFREPCARLIRSHRSPKQSGNRNGSRIAKRSVMARPC